MGKTKKELSREFMPQDYRKFNLVMGILLIASFIVGIAVCTALGLLCDNGIVIVVALFVWLFALVAVLITLLVLSGKKQKELIRRRTEETKNEFTNVQFEEAEALLKEKNVITDVGFVADCGEYAGKLVVPFSEATVSVYSANIYTKVCTVIVILNASGGVVAEYPLDNILYNYVFKKGVKINFVGNSGLLVTDKEAFIKKHLGRDEEQMTMAFLFGAIGALAASSSNNQALSRKTVLRVLTK